MFRFQPSVAFHLETGNLPRKPKQITGFCVERNFGLKLVKEWTSKEKKIPKRRIHISSGAGAQKQNFQAHFPQRTYCT